MLTFVFDATSGNIITSYTHGTFTTEQVGDSLASAMDLHIYLPTVYNNLVISPDAASHEYSP